MRQPFAQSRGETRVGSRPPHLNTWDIFCRVIDNFGDAGICWRLARQLAREHAAQVRLWIDDLASLHLLCPAVESRRDRQEVEGVQVWRWEDEYVAAATPAAFVVAAFGCQLSAAYTKAMVARRPLPVWVILEYLSAEPWVKAHHGLPSPHPHLPLERFFFFPGFEQATGGVLRETDLFARRNAFGSEGRERFWNSLGFELPPAGADVVSLFVYPQAPIADLLGCCAKAERPTVVAVPDGPIAACVGDLVASAGKPAGRILRRGTLEVRAVPFLSQQRYDELLWSCDCNFVRGEDSFVRAQWAARPFVWHIYPQREKAHQPKLEAFLDRYCEKLPGGPAHAVREMWRQWNFMHGQRVDVGGAWAAFRAQRSALEAHAREWAGRLGTLPNLAERLVQFCRDRLK